MDEMGEETGHEIVIVVPKRRKEGGDNAMEKNDCVEFLVHELEKAGLVVERFRGVPAEFLKVFFFIFFLFISLNKLLFVSLKYVLMRNQRR